MPIRHRTVTLSVAAALAAFAAPAAFAQQQPDPVTLLINQGNYWQAHRRGDLAAQSWQKLLQLNPKQPDALYGMGLVEADRGRNDLAQGYLDQLKQVSPNNPDVTKLAERLGQGAPQNPNLSAARELAQQGKNAAAVQQYQQALATDKTASASPEVQLEYYQTLGGTSQGWDQARRGLEKLAQDHPNDPKFSLALAQQLTYREASRREGIRLLSELALQPSVATQAKASWRQALIWLGARPADEPLYQAYLKVVPDDAAVKARLDTLAQQVQTARAEAAANAGATALGKAVSQGFQALQSGDLDTATARFQGVLADHPNDADALGGMGVLRLRQEKFAEAEDLLERASRGPNPGRWRSALNSATYWALVNSANAQRKQGGQQNIERARGQLERAITIDPNEVTAQNALGDLLLSSGDAKGAEAAYRMVLRRQSNNPDAIRGLIGALTQEGRGDEALQLAGQLTEQQQQQIGGLGALRAQQQQAAARTAVQDGDLATARTDLENALLNDPDSPWIRLDLARVYMQQGELTDARSVMDGLLVSHPDMPDALYASALLYSELGDWNRTLQTLNRVPQQSRTHDMQTLQLRAWVHASADRAIALAGQRQMAQAHAIADQIASVAGNDPELVGAAASVYAATGDNIHALTLMRQMLAQTPRPDAGMRIQYAGILLSTQQDAELSGVLRQIESMQLTPAQRSDFDKLQLAYVLREADQLREQGDLVNAYNTIAPALVAHPNDPDLQAALARMYSAAGEYDQALRLYTAAHTARPADLDITMGAAGTAVQAKQYSYAEQAIDSAVRQAPNNPRVLAAAGRIYRAEGKNSRAADYFRKSLAAENTPVDGASGPLGLRLVSQNGDGAAQGQFAPDRMPSNPFIGKAIVNPAGGPAVAQTGPVMTGAQPTPGQFSGTGGPQAQPSPGTPAPYPYPTQPYSPQPMPYLQPNSPPAVQQAPAPTGYGYSPGAAPGYQPPPYPAPTSYVQPSWRQVSVSGSESEGAGYAGSASSGGGDDQGYAQGGYPQQPGGYGYAPNGYPQQGYPQQGYAQNGYPQGGYPQNGGYAPNPPPAYPPNNGYAPNGNQQAYQQAYQQGYQQAYQQAYQQGLQQAYQQGLQQAYQQGLRQGGNGGGYPAPPQGVWQPPANGYPNAEARYADEGSNDCMSTGADGGTTSAAGAGNASRTEQTCVPPLPAKRPAARRRIARAPITRVAARSNPPYPQSYQQPYPQPQPYAPPYQPAQPYAYQPQYAQAPAQQYTQTQAPPDNAPVWNNGISAQPGAAAAPNAPLTVQEELDQINQQTASTVAAGVTVHNRAGEAGLSALTDIEAPIEGRVGAGDGHIVVRVTPVTLDAGTPDPAYSVSSRFGSGPAAAYTQSLTNGVAVGDQNANGVGVSLGYQTNRLNADIGSTPIGFQQTNIVGGINYRGNIDDQTTYVFDASRRAVTDSLLSYAGTTDPRTGLSWGGITSSGARLDMTWDDGTNGVYGYGSYNYLMGENVESNTRGEGGGGVYTRLIKETNEVLTGGVNVTAFGYDKNLSYFTYGQGGYFSPQQYISLSIPMSWDARSGKFSYQVKGSLGIQYFREDSSPYFPTNAGLQASANAAQSAAAQANLTTSTSAVYPGQSKTGLGYDLEASGEYQMAPQLFFGGVLGTDNARDYNEWYGGVYLRYAFEKMTGLPTMPPAPLRSQYLPN